MTTRMIVLAVTAVLLATSGCADKSTPPQSSATSSAASSETAKPMNDALAQRLDAAVNHAMTAAGVPGAIIGIWGPDGDYVRAFGVADKNTRAPMKADFYSRIGSVTKTFTVTAVLQLADQGKLSLDDPIAEFVDGVPLGDKSRCASSRGCRVGFSTTALHRLSSMHCSPIRGERSLRANCWTTRSSSRTNFHPAKDSNTATPTRSCSVSVVQKVSGQPLHSYIHDHILAPLGMSHTSFPTTNAFPDPHAQGYTVQTADGKEATATDWNPSWGWAAGAMISTLDDMRDLGGRAGHRKATHAADARAAAADRGSPGMPPQDGYGLGIFNLGGWIGHNGSLPGYQTVAVYLPEKQTSLVILTNTDIEYQGASQAPRWRPRSPKS